MIIHFLVTIKHKINAALHIESSDGRRRDGGVRGATPV